MKEKTAIPRLDLRACRQELLQAVADCELMKTEALQAYQSHLEVTALISEEDEKSLRLSLCVMLLHFESHAHALRRLVGLPRLVEEASGNPK